MADVSSIPLPFDNIHIPIIFYVVLVFIGILFCCGIFGYLLYDWNLGRPLRVFFTTRIKRWQNHKLALFEILSLSNNLRFEECEGSRESGYSKISKTITKRTVDKKKMVKGFALALVLLIVTIIAVILLKVNILYSVIGLLAFIIPMQIYTNRPTTTEVIGDNGRKIAYIIPKSIYSVNAIDVVPLLDLHPKIPERVEAGLKACVTQGIKKLSELAEKAKNTPNEILYNDVTFDSFYALYIAFKNKYETNVRVSDILNFISSNVDETAGESLELKDYNQMTHKKQNDKFIKYVYIGIFLMCLVFCIKVVYRIFHPA